MDSLPEQIKNNIIMYSVPKYPYLETLKKVNKHIDELAEEFDNDRLAGISIWKTNCYHLADGFFIDFFNRTLIY